MRANGIIRGDTDAPTTFSDLQHGATIQIAQIAIQDELNELTADNLLAYEKTSSTVSAVGGTRAYSLASDFVRFYGTPMLYVSADNFEIFEYPGGEDKLKLFDPAYKTTPGSPYSWYFELATTNKIAFYPVPDTAKSYAYDYEKDVSVTNSTDTLPFHNEPEAQAFCRMAARRFKYLFEEGSDINAIQKDIERMAAKVTLINLMRGTNPVNRYGPAYR